MKANSIAVTILSTALILGVSACGSDDTESSDTQAPSASTERGADAGSGEKPSEKSAGKPSASASSAEVTIDGAALEGDLLITCDSESQLGSPTSLFIASEDGATLGGQSVGTMVSLSIGYSDAKAAADATVNTPELTVITVAPGMKGYEQQQISGTVDGDKWTFNITAPKIGSTDMHTITGSATCTPIN